jgi:hypothetical protein
MERGIYICNLFDYFVSLASPKILSFENAKEKLVFLLHSAHLIVSLHAVIKN